MIRRLALFVFVTATGVLAACAGEEEIVRSETLVNLTEFTTSGPSGKSAELASLTTFEWEEAIYFMPYTARADAESVVGEELAVEDDYRFPYVVFVAGDGVVEILEVKPPFNLIGEHARRYPGSTQIEVKTEDPGPYSTSILVESS